ncbi:MAG: RDD family protein [Ignavibacteriae bacterium]|nr:RDD family protein [Ignavibacteriota bacterium]
MDELNKNNESEVIEEIVFVPASMWRRLGAWFIDTLILLGILLVAYFLFAIIILILDISLSDKSEEGILIIFSIVLNFVYYSFMESSNSMATLGKIAMNIMVTDYNGERISYGRSVIRTLSKYISAGLFYLGYLVGFLTEYTQMLHDFLAKTYVVDATPVRQVEEINEVQEDSAQ